MREATAAIGGRWEQRPWIARSIRIVSFLLPVAGSIAMGRFLTTMLPAPMSTAWGVARWVLVAVASTAALIGFERIARRLIPLSVLFRLSLAFPDTVPSRLGLAMRIGTTMQLKRRIDTMSTAASDETPGEAAHRLLELVGLLSRHDRMTRGHSERVRAYAHVVGTEMGIAGHELEQLRWSALLHDIGKIRVPGEILNKPGRLTDEEFEIIKTHPMAGKECVEPLAEWLGDSVRAVWEHHERFDGGGYPQGLAGADIARASRIVCVVDAYDVMTSTRSYKRAMSGEDARAELSKHAGSQFDPAVVRSFLSASIGQPLLRSRRTSALSHAALLPQALVQRLGSSFGSLAAIGAATAVGAVGGTVGIAMAERAPVDRVFASSSSSTTIVDRDESGRIASSLVRAAGPTATAPATSLVQPEDPTTSDVPERDPQDPATSVDFTPPTVAAPTTTPESETPPPTVTTTVATPAVTTTVVTPAVTTTVVTPTTNPPSLPTTTTTIALPTTDGPGVTLPVVTLPEVTRPPITLPVVTLPVVTLPVATVPAVTVPAVTAPAVTAPAVTLPEVTLPAVTLPDTGL